MKLHDIRPPKGARRPPKRVGRGIGSGHGKTSTRGHKGQLARSGGGKGPGFEGGQTPLHRRLPKFRRFSNAPFKTEWAYVNVGDLARAFAAGSTVTPESLVERRLVRDLRDGVKVLGDGELDRPLVVKAHRFSRQAVEKIQAAGGTVEVIER
ncbi:MAG: 50S ribosomal protein L15 [Limnochordaceae bacterium]|uniref:Large ribosomal subunit protein uL15 n=1 Tax=Carboxydichorda subterranea TaxID=3109565 RepID=A0ABZ1BY73_9FIRM|nr:50S ribosomal protein L15 [Limnochorda sp. L945t]MBE3599016.1 50S ribosomal protein L15 [Limnochordaceae bacterium]WRP17732.1 50S ribosomal protein L15 [Limnochorda sp. L945t]